MKTQMMTKTHRLLIRFRPVLRFIKARILHTDDSPEQIARGIAIGLFAAWLPLFGLQILLSLLFAAILRANKAMAILFTWISNPLTAVFIYYPAYRIGRWILGIFERKPHIEEILDPEHIEDIFTETLSIGHVVTDFFTLTLWKQIWTVFAQMGLETLIGGILLGLIAAKIGYWVSLAVIKRLLARRQRKLTMKGKIR